MTLLAAFMFFIASWTDGKSPEAQAPSIAAPMSMHSLSRARTQGSPENKT